MSRGSDLDPGATAFARLPRWWWLAVLAAVPFVVALVASLTGGWYVTSDAAIFATRVLDAPGDLPLVGVYSRFGWYHPGPALAWWFLFPSWASGGAPAVLLATGMALKGLAAVTATVLGGRRAGFVGAALMASLATVLLITHPDSAFTIWNPTVVMLGFLCFLVAAWSVADGDRWAPVVLVVAGSVCAQAHVGYLPPVVVVSGAAALVAVVGEWRRTEPGRGWRVPLLVAGVSGVLVWAPVLYDQILGSGNLGTLITYFTGEQGDSLGVASALGVAARSYVPWGPWLGGAEPIGLLGDLVAAPLWWLALPLLALGSGALSAWLRRDRVLGTLVTVMAVAAVAGVITLSSLSDVPYPYLFAWSRVVGAMIWFTALLAGVRTLVDLRPGWAVGARSAVAVVTASVVLVAAVVVPSSPRPEPVQSDAVEALLPAAEAATARGETVAMTFKEPFPGVAEGLVYELERSGRLVTVGPENAFVWSGSRGAAPDDADVRLAVASGAALETWAQDLTWEELDRFDPLDPGERAEYERLGAELRSRLGETAPAGVSEFVTNAPRLFRGDPNLADIDLERYIELSPRRDVWVLARQR